MTTTTTTAFLRNADLDKPKRLAYRKECTRCGGAGGYAGWPGFTCYRCGGATWDPTPAMLWTYPTSWTEEACAAHESERNAKAAARRAAKEAKRAAEADAARDGWLAANPEVAEVLATVHDVDDFLADMRTALKVYGTLTEKQAAAVARYPEREAARAERDAADAAKALAAEDVPEGTTEVAGTVLTTKWVDSQYGGSLKMLVEDDRGWKVWGTVPASIDVERGDRVTFTATVEPSGDDRLFGFYKRPRKATVMSATDRAMAAHDEATALTYGRTEPEEVPTAAEVAALINAYAARAGIDLGAGDLGSPRGDLVAANAADLLAFVEVLLTSTGGRRQYPAADLARTTPGWAACHTTTTTHQGE